MYLTRVVLNNVKLFWNKNGSRGPIGLKAGLRLSIAFFLKMWGGAFCCGTLMMKCDVI